MIDPADAALIEGFALHQTMRGFTPATLKRRRWTVTNFAKELPDGIGLSNAAEVHVEAFLGRRATATTRRALLADLRMFFRWGRRRGGLTVDPTADMESIRIPHRDPSPLTHDDLERVYAAGDHRMRLMLALGAYAGLRVSEMAALRIVDVRLDDGLLVVRQGKGNKDRTVPLAPLLVDLLADGLPHALRPELVRRNDGAEFVLGGVVGGAVSNAIAAHFKRLGIRARPHDLRHSFGTEAARAANGNLVLVAQLMGHASISTTQRYVGWTPAGADVVNQLHRRAG